MHPVIRFPIARPRFLTRLLSYGIVEVRLHSIKEECRKQRSLRSPCVSSFVVKYLLHEVGRRGTSHIIMPRESKCHSSSICELPPFSRADSQLRCGTRPIDVGTPTPKRRFRTGILRTERVFR